ncbi:hypothetical protein Zmor_003022 [Zophobas morio]|uniref:Vitellogenin n=1 Tax=Zophobas morio TaxID=2755281 RepID=A0AA38HL14_9CUCU|nr:hypothetical protein Zmor_003022 [Zophobas morio]
MRTTPVSFAYADHNPGWQHNQEYAYKVSGRILTSLNQINKNYTGIVLTSDLFIQPTSDGHLIAKLSNVRYSDLHSKLNDAQEILQSPLDYKQLPLSSKPFKIVMNNGVVHDLVVDRSISNWEANMIKGVVSQLQIDTEAENKIRSSINILPQDDSETAVFKTMEKTVTGESETLYEIHPFPEYLLQTEPSLAPKKHQDEKLIEVVKHKHFTHSKESPGYHFGFEGADGFEIGNKIGEFFSRSSTSRIILSGSLKNFTLQSSVTFDEVSLRPNLEDTQRGSTLSIVNITLDFMQPLSQKMEDVSNPISVGIVYRYNKPFGKSNKPQPKIKTDSDDSGSSASSSQMKDSVSSTASSEGGGVARPEIYLHVQEKPHMDEAPAAPLLPLTVGFDGQAISLLHDIKERVRSLAKIVGQEFQEPKNIPEQNTLGKFLMLTSLVKLMNYKEMKQVAEELYRKNQHRTSGATWVAYRDAVAQTGTGPGLKCIEEWIRNDQVSGNEAAELVATAANSARYPTEEYMKFFFEMVQNTQFMGLEALNESLVLSYSSLLYHVYVNAKDSHNKYPVHSFGTFNTIDGRSFVKDKVIPYFSTMLDKAVTETHTKQIHVYIRALGNVGHQRILSVFKPYLEGKKKVSQFQRILMVMALDNLVNNKPKAARSVLFKIYQNAKDFDQVRVAAVYQLIRASPSSAMLQEMAAYTKIDTSIQVNVAVKSAIEAAATLDVPRLAKIREAAWSAKPYLTTENFDTQNSKIYLQNYMVEQMKIEIKQITEFVGGEDCVLPRGINYMLRSRVGGVKQQIVNLKTLTSSVDDLTNVFEQQTKSYRQLLQEKQASESIKTKWSSEHTAKLLNMQNEQREQLESYMFFHIASLQKIFSFDNQTIENITQVVREIEEELKHGKHLDYNKMAVQPEMVVSFPLSWGLPFIHSYDRPTMIHLESDVKVVSNPSVYSEEGLQKPETVNAEFQVHGFMTGRAQSQFGIFTPFNHKRYSAGYDKNFQLLIPHLTAKLHLDVKNKQTTWEITNPKPENNVTLVHFSTWPYTTQNDICSIKHHKEIIFQRNPQKMDVVFGEKSTGIAFSLKMTGNQKIDYGFLYNKITNNGLMAMFLGSWLDENIEHVQIDFGIRSAQTTVHKMVIHLGHQEQYSPGSSKPKDLEKIQTQHPISKESWERQSEFLKNSSLGISNVQAEVFDAVVLLEGQKVMKYSATISGGRSNVDPKGRILMQVAKDNQEEKPVKVYIVSNSNIPNIPSLSLDSVLNFDPSATVEIEGTVDGDENESQINAKVQLFRSENRKQYLKNQPEYKVCQEQMTKGNHQLPPCAILTAQSSILDQFMISFEYQNIDPVVVNQTYKLYSVLRHYMYPRISENIIDSYSHGRNSVIIKGQYSPDLSSLSASISGSSGRIEIDKLPMDPLSRQPLVLHPVHQTKTHVQGHLLNDPSYQAFCVVDYDAVNTLDNKTYPVTLGKDWVVMFHYVPRRPSSVKKYPDLSVTDQLNQQIEGYIVYVRANPEDQSQNKFQKEIRIVIQSPNTLAKVIDVTLKPSGTTTGYPRLFIQDEPITYAESTSHVHEGYMQVYTLPHNEVKMVVYDAFTIVYDGVRAKLTVTNDKFRDAARGLCGTFTGEPETDFTYPGNCVIRSSEVFVASNTVSEKQDTKRMNGMLMIQGEDNTCYQKTVGYVDVVSVYDSGLAMSPINYRTKYVIMGDQICFSIRPLPDCNFGYKKRTVSRQVPAHCLTMSGLAHLYKKEIDAGANPSFQRKNHNRNVAMPIAESCEL